MTVATIFRRLRGALGNALVWGVGWSAAAFVVMAVMGVAGMLPATFSWIGALELAAKFGIFGGIAGAAFSSVIRILYHGHHLRDIGWVRFGIIGGIATGVFVPLFMQLMNLLSGDGLVAWKLVLDDAVLTAVFGGAVAGISLKLAQLGDVLPSGENQDRIDPSVGMDRLASAEERDTP